MDKTVCYHTVTGRYFLSGQSLNPLSERLSGDSPRRKGKGVLIFCKFVFIFPSLCVMMYKTKYVQQKELLRTVQ